MTTHWSRQKLPNARNSSAWGSDGAGRLQVPRTDEQQQIHNPKSAKGNTPDWVRGFRRRPPARREQTARALTMIWEVTTQMGLVTTTLMALHKNGQPKQQFARSTQDAHKTNREFIWRNVEDEAIRAKKMMRVRVWFLNLVRGKEAAGLRRRPPQRGPGVQRIRQSAPSAAKRSGVQPIRDGRVSRRNNNARSYTGAHWLVSFHLVVTGKGRIAAPRGGRGAFTRFAVVDPLPPSKPPDS